MPLKQRKNSQAVTLRPIIQLILKAVKRHTTADEAETISLTLPTPQLRLLTSRVE